MKEKMLFKVSTLVLAILVVFSMFLIACGSNEPTIETTESNASETAVTETVKEPVTLSVIMLQAWKKEGIAEIFAKYEGKTGNKIDLQLLPDDKGQDVIRARFASNEMPDIQLMNCGIENYTFMKPADNLEDLSNEAWASTLTAPAKDNASWQGKLYGLPLWGNDYWCLVYNKDIYNKSGIQVPKSHDEMMSAFEILKGNGYQPLYIGTKDVWPIAGPIMGISLGDVLLNTDSDVITRMNTNKAKFADFPSFALTMEHMKELGKKGYIGKNFMSDTWDGQFEALAKDKAATGLAYTAWLSEIETKFPGTKDKFGFYPIYLGNNKSLEDGGVGAWFVVKGKHSIEAKELLSFAAQPEMTTIYYEKNISIPSFNNIKVSLMAAQQELTEKIISGEFTVVPGQHGSILAQDVMTLGKLVQDVMLDSKTAEQAISEYDTARAKTAKGLKLEGFN